MSEPPQQHGVEFGRLSERMDHVVDAIDKLTRMFEGIEARIEARFARKDHTEFKLLALEDRLQKMEAAREEDRKNGGMLAWWKNVTAIFAGFAVICTVAGVVVALVLKLAKS